MFGSLGFPELIVILVIVIIIFGANRLPQLGQGVGSAIRNFKKGMADTGDPVDPDERSASARTATCASCGTVNAADSRFCRKCGGKL